MRPEDVERIFRKLLKQGLSRDEAKQVLLALGVKKTDISEIVTHIRVAERWKDTDLQELLRHFKRQPVKLLAKSLKRSVAAVYKQAERMKKPPPLRFLRKATRCPRCGGRAEVYMLRPNPDVKAGEVWVAKCKARPPCPGLHFLMVEKENLLASDQIMKDLHSDSSHSSAQ